MVEQLVLAGCVVCLCEDGNTLSLYPDGATVHARAEDTDAYRLTAAAHGYGDDTAALSREHELGHHVLAHLLGLSYSPTMRAIGLGQSDPTGLVEEAAVLALQRYARAMGVSLIEVARRLAQAVGADPVITGVEL